MSTKKILNRRDFLKLAGLTPLSMMIPRFLREKPAKKNIIIIVFDALSAANISLHGYPRETMPNLTRLAERAIVYHKHYAGSNYTTTGTASLLTGTHGWTHRALQYDSGVSENKQSHNIFNAFQDYYRIAYTHNPWADTLLKQFESDIEELIPRKQLTLESYGNIVQTLFENDQDLATISWMRNSKLRETGYAYSLFFSRLYEPLQDRKTKKLLPQFPRGIPTGNSDDRLVLEQATEWLGDRIADIDQPFLGYFHFMPPHAPYRTSREFVNYFKEDGYKPIEKPVGVFTATQDKYDLARKRTEYDEFILYADREFGRFYEHLEQTGLLDNTILVVTSDHGELFERGLTGHNLSAMYEPVIRIPLLIFEPGRTARLDVYSPTSAIDVLPTLCQMANTEIPSWNEGNILPPFGEANEKSVYSIRASKTEQNQPLTDKLSITLVKGKYKIHYYAGYAETEKNENKEMVSLFDLEEDPEELNDLSTSRKEIANAMLNELKTKLTEANKPYL
jgi:arylsulfatase A-like enzyme